MLCSHLASLVFLVAPRYTSPDQRPPEIRMLPFIQLQEPQALFVGLTVCWGLWRGFGDPSTGGVAG